MPTIADYSRGIQRALAAGDTEAAQYLHEQRNRAQAEAKSLDPLTDMGYGEKALANIGAGIDSTWQGAKQLVGAGAGDEALAEKRRLDSKLAGGTAGGGLLQFAGEVAPTIPLGMGVGALAGRALPGALRVAGMGAAEGATAGALMPTMGDESRLANTALGAAGGGAAPYVLKGAMRGAQGAGELLGRGAAALPGQIGERYAGRAAARDLGERLTKEVGPDLPPEVYRRHPHIEGPDASAAVATQNKDLAMLERESRAKTPGAWSDYDENVARGRWKTLDEGLQTPDDLKASLSRANEIGAQAPYEAAGPKRFVREMDDFFDKLQTAKATPEYHGNPAVKSAVDFIEKTMADAGTVTPALLHQIRRSIGKGLAGVPGAGDAGVRAASSEPFVISLTKGMDDVLNKSTKGKWDAWKGDYAEEMTRAEAAKADLNVRNKFVDEATGVSKAGVADAQGTPRITPTQLKKALAAQTMTRGPKRGQNALNTGSLDLLQGLDADLNAGNILQQVKYSGTSGGGSDTAMNLAQGALMESLLPTGLGISRIALGQAKQNIAEMSKKQMAELLQDPVKLRAFLRTQARIKQLRDMTQFAPGTGAAAGSLVNQ